MDFDLYNNSYLIFCNELTQKTPPILEIGCGPGNITKHILTHKPDCELLGIDIAPNMITMAQKNNPYAVFKIMDVRNIGTLTSKYDGIINGFCLPYMSTSDRLQFIKDCKNLLNPNGVLYISFVEGNYNDSGYQNSSTGDQIYFYYHHLDNVIKELTDHHFKIVKIIHKEYPKKDNTIEIHTIIIARPLV